MYEIGLSTNGKEINEELFAKYEKAGITAMEIAVAPEQYDILDYRCLRRQAASHNVRLWSLHLPFRPETRVNMAASDKNIRKNTVEYYTDIIKKASDIGIKIFVVHSNCSEPVEEDKMRDERIDMVRECLDVLAENAYREGANIAVENLPRSCIGRNSAELQRVLAVNSKLRVCYDTNHLMGETAQDFIRAVGDKIVTVHISDYDYMNERHWLPGEGKLDWQEILQNLKSVKYNGVWLYEIRFSCPKTIIRDRELTCEDFVRNAKEIFENRPISVFSKHKEKLGMWG